MSTLDAAAPVAPVLSGPAPHLLVIRAPYYQQVVDGMTAGALGILAESGATHDIIDVAGAYELPQAVRIAVRGQTRFDGCIVIGCVVRGETDHYDFICASTMQGLMSVSLQFGLAMGTALLTTDNLAQAEIRSGVGEAAEGMTNKGAEAAVAALRQIALARRLGAA